ncbi:hypothetical protein I350_03407 [Cryptococcus amylolentus CBS 6273]|uniref:XPG N-terminal domain-containing protein n=1 Tax=Cryptococcus amylolentus CBS 6273 TaxID=1296118 RepID=A0A1E3K3N0_9TREE|nr:hypothetical protein I350_03407 [Cryptococcus amylolentus CBS 6273]
MGIRGFDVYLKERKLLQSCPISHLANTRIGIDASYYINHLLTDPATREPLVAATGGIPYSIIQKIETDLRALEHRSIKPVFVFAGLPLAAKEPVKLPDQKAERENVAKNEAWALYDQGEPLLAVDKLNSCNGGNYVDQRDLLRSILRLFRHRFVEYVIAPYSSHAQLAYLLQHPKGYIHAIYSSSECLMWPVERVITSSDWSTTFQFADKVRILNDINLSSEQFLDMGLLCGSTLLRTMPLPTPEFSLKMISDFVRHHKSGLAVCQNLPHIPYKTQSYTESFWKARLAIKFSLVLTTEGQCVPLPTVIAPQQQAFTVQDVPADLEDIFSPKLPDEIYFYICRGIISTQVVGWVSSGTIVEQQPLLETNEYRRFIKDVITEGPTSPRCTTIALLLDCMHREWSSKRINVQYWFDPYVTGNNRGNNQVPYSDPLTQSLIARCQDWMVPMFSLEMELRRQNSSTIDLKLCLGALATEDLVNKTFKPKGDRTLDKKDEVVANSVWRFLEVRGFVQQNHTHSSIGKALHAAYDISKINDRFQEPLYLILELLRSGVVHGEKWGGPSAAPLPGGPSFGENDEQNTVRLVMRCISVLPLTNRPQQWVGPLSQELLAFNSFVKALSKSLRQLFESVSCHLLLSGDGRRNRDDFNDIMISLPFQTDVNTGFGILAKSYLDATAYHNDGEFVTEATAASEKSKAAKREAIAFVEANFSSVRNPVQELDRGFRFWDTVMVAIRTLAQAQGPTPTLAQTVVGKDVIEQFERADRWLKPMRP